MASPCVCPDDRCVGYHHAAGEPCLCGPATVERRVRALPRLAPDDEARVRDALRRIDQSTTEPSGEN